MIGSLCRAAEILCRVLGTSVVVSLVLAGAAALAYGAIRIFSRSVLIQREFSFALLIVCVATGFLGAMVGFLAGHSREAAIPTLLSALLPAFGAFYVLLRDRNATTILVIVSISLVFVANLLVGSLDGAAVRYAATESFEARAVRAAEDHRERKLRLNLGLDP